MGSTGPVRRAARPDRRRRRRRRAGLPVALAFLLLLAPAAYSYTTTMMQPSSLPLWPRSVEWLRAHHGNWLVDEVEHYYYSWKAPAKGGPQLTSLPTAGLTAAATERAEERHQAGFVPPPISPVFAHPLPGEGVWRGTGPSVRGTLAGAPDDLPDRGRLSANRRVRGVVRPHAHLGRVVPGPVRTSERPRPGADVRASRPALASARHVQRGLHLQRRRQRIVDQREVSTSRSRRASQPSWPIGTVAWM